MPPNKYSFASVLASNQGHFEQFERSRRASPDRESFHTADGRPSPRDDFSLDPQATAAAAPPVAIPPRESSSRGSSKVRSKKSIKEVKKSKRKPDNIAIPPRSSHGRAQAQAEADWPLPSPKPSLANSENAMGLRATSSHYSQHTADGSEVLQVPPQDISLADLREQLLNKTAVNDFANEERPPTAASTRPPSTLPQSSLSFGIKKKVNMTLDDFLKEVPAAPRSPLTPLSPRFPRPDTAQTASSGARSPVRSIFKGFSSFGPFGRPRNGSRQDSRKDSSSASSYHTRTASDQVSEDTARTSWESIPRAPSECPPPVIRESRESGRVSESKYRPSQESQAQMIVAEPLLDFGALHPEDSPPAEKTFSTKQFSAFADFDSLIETASRVDTIDVQSETDSQTETDTQDETDADPDPVADDSTPNGITIKDVPLNGVTPADASANVTTLSDTTPTDAPATIDTSPARRRFLDEDLDSDHPDAPTDTESPTGTGTPAGSRTPTKVDHFTDTENETATDTDNDYRTETEYGYHTDTDNGSVMSTPASVIEAIDLSAAPPTINRPRHSASDPAFAMARPERSLSIDSAAPPPITLLRGEQDTPKAKKPQKGGFNGRISLLKRATSKPEVKLPKPNRADIEQDKRERMAELELLTKSVPYEKASRGMTPFTSKMVANTYPHRRAIPNSGRGVDYSKSKKRQIGQGLREEQILLGAMEEAHWREKERRARLAAEAEYLRVMREGTLSQNGDYASSRHQKGLSTIDESSWDGQVR